jgi:hypothetical protein
MRTAILLLSITCIAHTPSVADEGMFPVSEIHRLQLRAAGLELDPLELYNPQSVSLIDAIVNVGGCTGSLVSPEGLILTNHHCAFRAIQSISTTEHDYLRDGFLARSRGEELPAPGYTVRITESYRDVSSEVLSSVSEGMDPVARTKAISRRMKEIASAEEKRHPGKRAEVAEMFAGKTYVLFLYTHLRDVRLVYAPPRSIGEFGGEFDNWVWPRHTGDFTFMRAYVAPDGSPAGYAAENVPYKPRKHLRVQPRGVNEEEFVFILGYPGRTYRHLTSSFLAYEEDIRMPFVAELYEWQITTLESEGKKDPSVALQFAPRIKSMANVMKNYKGKLKGLRQLGIVQTKAQEEKALQEFIAQDPDRISKYGASLKEIEDVYAEMRRNAPKELLLDQLLRSSTALEIAYALHESAVERKKDDLHEGTDRKLLREFFRRAAQLPQEQRLNGLDRFMGTTWDPARIDAFLDRLYADVTFLNEEGIRSLFELPLEETENRTGELHELARSIFPMLKELRQVRERRDGLLSRLYAGFVDVKAAYLQKNFIPDANRTLRLTYGRIRGYSPTDATYYSPITTVKGVVEKTSGVIPFDTPEKLLQLYKKKDFGNYAHPRLKDVPVAILYNLDTTGGNSSV